MGVPKAAMRKAIYFGQDQYSPRDRTRQSSGRECDFDFTDRCNFHSPGIIHTNI